MLHEFNDGGSVESSDKEGRIERVRQVGGGPFEVVVRRRQVAHGIVIKQATTEGVGTTAFGT